MTSVEEWKGHGLSVHQMTCCSVQFSSVTQSCPTLCDPMNRSTPGLPVHHQLPEFTQAHVHRVSDAIQPSHPLCPLLLLPPIPPSIRVFSSGSTLCMRWPKYWSFSFSISPSKEHASLFTSETDIYTYLLTRCLPSTGLGVEIEFKQKGIIPAFMEIRV